VLGHEVMESITDPWLNAWLDPSDSEIGDKCAWTFQTPYVTLSNNARFKVQGEWSNNAYLNGIGSPQGCVTSS